MRKLLVILTAVAMVCAFTVPVMAAAEWNFYGSARMSTFWNDADDDWTPMFGQAADDADLEHYLQGNARLGATVKNGDIGGGFEYGTGINLRKLYGTWNFGGGEILVGQTYTPCVKFYSDQVWKTDEGLLSLGDLYASRRAMVQLSTGGFKIALVEPSTVGGTGDVDVSLPKIEVSYDLKMDALSLYFAGGYNTFEINDGDSSVDSYVAAVGAKFDAGAFYCAGKVHYGQNMGNYNEYGQGMYRNYDAASDEDSNTLGVIFVAGFKASDTLNIQGGVGYFKNELDDAEDQNFAYYVQCKIDIAPGFFIVPEIGIIDEDDYDNGATSVDQGSLFYAGLKWQINF